MRLDELNWMDVERYLETENRLIFVLGACEQHGYLSLLTDVKIPLALADAASQRTGVLVAPPVNYGTSPYFLAYPGTLSLRLTTLVDIVEDLVRSAYSQGFRRFLFLNGHGGNDPARARLYELSNQMPEMRLAWYSWWLSYSVEVVAQKYELKPAHANWLEAFAFTQVTELPEAKKAPPVVRGLLNAKEARETYGDGTFGGLYQVDRTIMDEMFAACLADVLQSLAF